MKIRNLFVAIMAALLFVSAAQAAEVQKEEESSPSNELTVTTYRGDVAAKLYLEHGVTENFAVYLNVTKSKGFEEVIIGPAYYITPELEVGIGAGVARYTAGDEDAKSNHRVVSGFLYYKSDAAEGELSVSRYARDPDPIWYQTYVQWSLGDRWAAGVFGEALIGWGPRLSWSPYKNVSLWISPIVKKLGDDNHKLVGGIAVAF